MENSLATLKKLNIVLPYDLAMLLLGMYPRDVKTYVHTKTCREMFIAALFIIVKKVERARCGGSCL